MTLNVETSHRNNLQRKSRCSIFIPTSYLARPHRLSSITARTSWSRLRGNEVHLSLFYQPEKKATPPRLQSPSEQQQRCRAGGKKSAGTLCNFSAKWILFNLAAWDGPGPPDNVDGWCFNAAECYFYWTGKTINFYFIGNDCAPCIKKHGGGGTHE